MGGDGSGRRGIKETDDPEAFPDLEDTEESVLAQMRAVNRALLTQAIDPRVADSIVGAARVALSSIRQRKENAKLEELREMLARAEELMLGMDAYESDVRQNRINPPAAVWELSPDGLLVPKKGVKA